MEINGRNISVSSRNGYTVDKVLEAEKYLKEIGSNKRNFPFEKLVKMYNDLLGTNESPNGCRCQAPKFYNGIANFAKYGRLTLEVNGIKVEKEEGKKVEEPIVEDVKDEVDEEPKKSVGRPKKNKE